MEQLPEKIEKERTPKRVFVEMGTEWLAMPWFGGAALQPDDLYVGVDIERDSLRHSKKSTGLSEVAAGRPRSNENILYVEANAKRMPVRDRTAHEVFLGNVMGDPSIQEFSKETFIAEARRIVRDDGRIVIKETNTPANRDSVQGILQRHGFRIEKLIGFKDAEWGKTLEQYQIIRTSDKRSYIIFARPVIAS